MAGTSYPDCKAAAGASARRNRLDETRRRFALKAAMDSPVPLASLVLQRSLQPRARPVRSNSLPPMGWRALRPVLGFAAVAGITAVANSAIAGSAQTATGAKVTPKGVGGVKIGATFTKLRQRHLVGRLQRGC